MAGIHRQRPFPSPLNEPKFIRKEHCFVYMDAQCLPGYRRDSYKGHRHLQLDIGADPVYYDIFDNHSADGSWKRNFLTVNYVVSRQLPVVSSMFKDLLYKRF
jgi:hypothetical protein